MTFYYETKLRAGSFAIWFILIVTKYLFDMVFRLNIHCCLVRAKRTHTFACEMYACMLTLCVHLLFKVLIIQFYVLLFTDKLQRVVFLIFSRNLCSTNLKSDYEYAFSQATSIEYVHMFICIYAYNVAKGKMHHNPILYCFVNMWARSSFYAIFRIVFVFFAQSNEYFYELKRFTMQRKTYCSPSIFMRMHMLNIWRIKKTPTQRHARSWNTICGTISCCTP